MLLDNLDLRAAVYQGKQTYDWSWFTALLVL